MQLQEYFPLELEPSITSSLRTIIKSLKDAGASIRPVSLPATQYALSAYYVIASAEASSNLARFDGIQYGSFCLLFLSNDGTSSLAVTDRSSRSAPLWSIPLETK